MEKTRYAVRQCFECGLFDVYWDDGEKDEPDLIVECLKCQEEMEFKGYIDEVPLKDFIWHTVKKED